MLFVIVLSACNPNDVNNLLVTRDNYIGIWSVSDQEVPITKNNYTATITADPDNSSQVLISNFHQFGTNYKVKGIVSGKNLTIETQLVVGSTNVYGAGQLNNGTLTITYYTDDGADRLKFVANYTK